MALVDATAAQMPDPLTERPPADRYCDLVLNGGVASGVVYPWALLHLARHYRFKSIGGNSVGAMAAALAAAAEYGRCHGLEDSFEPLRRLPLKLAEVEDGDAEQRTKMLRLFQPTPSVRRLFDLFLAAVTWSNPEPTNPDLDEVNNEAQPYERVGIGPLLPALKLYGFWPAFALLALLLGGWSYTLVPNAWGTTLLLTALPTAALFALVVVGVNFYRDLRELAANGYGLCSGLGQSTNEEGLVEWLHRGIQLSAGRGREDPPLTFADLWAAPRFGRRGPAAAEGGLQPEDPGIELQMFTSNVTHGRPVRLPLNDGNTRLFYNPAEWELFFPPSVLDALKAVSRAYEPTSGSDPPASTADPDGRYFELPGGELPIIVAARMSLCFPLLFSCVPVYAIDYETPQAQRVLRKCLLSDGGLCANFPIHLFDAAHPQWPTFAFLFDERRRAYDKDSVWLPEAHLQGRSDNWQRGVPGAEDDERAHRPVAMRLLGLAGGLLLTMKDWNDRVTGRLPQVRNRVIRLALRKGEGQLNIAMPQATILRMAHEYGTDAGIALVERYLPEAKDTGHAPSPAWRQHLYVRSMIELRALERHLRRYTSAVRRRGDSIPLRQLLDEAVHESPLLELAGKNRTKPIRSCLESRQHRSLLRAIDAIEALEAELAACRADFDGYLPVAEPELHLRPPI